MYDSQGEEKTKSTSEKGKTVNASQKETVKSCDGFISIYERKKFATKCTNKHMHNNGFYQGSIHKF